MTSPRWLNDSEQQLWRLILSGFRKLERGMEDTLQQNHKLSTSEFSVLVNLSESPHHEVRLRDLCSALQWDRSRTSHQITRMEKRGLVTKNKCEGDARGVVIELTDLGEQRLSAAAPDHVESVRRLVFDHMTPEQAEVLQTFFTNLTNVENIPVDPTPKG